MFTHIYTYVLKIRWGLNTTAAKQLVSDFARFVGKIGGSIRTNCTVWNLLMWADWPTFFDEKKNDPVKLLY